MTAREWKVLSTAKPTEIDLSSAAAAGSIALWAPRHGWRT